MGGGWGGGGGGGGATSPKTGVIFSGRAYPRSTVTILKDAQVVSSIIAGTDSNFQVEVSNLAAGNYTFSVYGEDDKGNRSSMLVFPAGVTANTTTRISGIFIAPTISVDKSEVKKGEDIAIFGQSAPQADVTININSDNEFFEKVKTDNNGVYLLNFDTSFLEMGQHFTRAKAASNGEISSFGKSISFLVGSKTVLAPKTEKILKGDLNGDSKVNLVDFSIAAYWYKRKPLSANFAIKEKERLNGDGKIDLVDFSIMAYYWTG